MYLLDLPDHILTHISSHLLFDDFRNFRLTCKAFHVTTYTKDAFVGLLLCINRGFENYPSLFILLKKLQYSKNVRIHISDIKILKTCY